MNKLILLLTLCFSLILSGCMMNQKNDLEPKKPKIDNSNIIDKLPDDKYYCKTNSECGYSDTGKECVNIKYGVPQDNFFDIPSCICNNNKCEFEPCENPPCELG